MLLRYFMMMGCCFLLGSCMTSPYYQKHYSIPDNEWDYDYKPVFRFEVKDTGVYYTMYFIIRHTEAYPYSNLWLRVNTQQPGDSVAATTRIEIPLATPAGQWLGRGMGSIWEQRMAITDIQDAQVLGKPGIYEFSLEQDMRVNPLPEVLQVGLRVEKGAEKKQSD
jgi:gliding motility-associated lipoprotein GldH